MNTLTLYGNTSVLQYICFSLVCRTSRFLKSSIQYVRMLSTERCVTRELTFSLSVLQAYRHIGRARTFTECAVRRDISHNQNDGYYFLIHVNSIRINCFPKAVFRVHFFSITSVIVRASPFIFV